MVHNVIVDGLVDKHREQVFPKDEFTESMNHDQLRDNAYSYREAHMCRHMAFVHQVPQARWNHL